MVDVSIAGPGQLSASELETAQTLVQSAFGDGFRAHDWLHAIGGQHVLVTEEGILLAHAAVVARTLRHDDVCFDTGYVEAVAVRADHQGRGLGRLVMDQAESLIRACHQIGALNAVEDAAPFYASRGWLPWTGRTQADTPGGTVDTYDVADRIFLLPPASVPSLSPNRPLVCDWRIGDLW